MQSLLISVSISINTGKSRFISKLRHLTECHRRFWGVQLPQTAPLDPSLNANRIIFLRCVFPTTLSFPAIPPQTKSSFSSKFLLHFGRMPRLRFCQPKLSAQEHVPLEMLWGVLREYGVDGRLLLVVKSLYSCSEVCVRVGRVKSRLFTVGVGIRQWCVLSPLLCIVYIGGL